MIGERAHPHLSLTLSSSATQNPACKSSGLHAISYGYTDGAGPHCWTAMIVTNLFILRIDCRRPSELQISSLKHRNEC